MNITFAGACKHILLKGCRENESGKVDQKVSYANVPSKFKPLSKDIIAFTRKAKAEKPRRIEVESKATPLRYDLINGVEVPVFEYINKYHRKLSAKPLITLATDLSRDPTVHDSGKAYERITSYSRYLKEDMVGFYTPSGDHWFEKACTFLIKGAAGIDLPESMYYKYAKEFWGLMAKADDFWTSDEFVDYLKTLEANPGVKATIEAVKDLQKEHVRLSSNISFGYNSELKFIPELLAHGGAYTSHPLKLSYNPDEHDPYYPSLEHIFPHVEGGDDVNLACNYVLSTAESNSARSDIPLVDYLKGWDSDDYYEKYPRWKSNLKKRIKTAVNRQNNVKSLNRKEKKEVQTLLKKYNSGEYVNFSQLSPKIKDALSYAIRQQKEVLSQKIASNPYFSKVTVK